VRIGLSRTFVDDRHWPELLSDLARRLDEASSGRAAMTLDSVLHQRRRPLASASDRPSTTRGSRGTNLPSAGDDAVPGRLPASHQRDTDQPEEATMDNDDAKRPWRGGETALGGLLVLLGILVLAGQAVDVEVGEVGWPFFVIVPGLGLLGLGLTAAGRLGEVLAMVGGVISVNGLVLLVQNATDRFDTWAYAWTLVFLVGPGIGRWLVGVVRGRGDLAASGGWLIAVGLAGFLGLAVVFEVIIGIGGRGYGAAGRYGLAVLLIGAGLVLVGRRLWTRI
jgi:hypothetical protein